MAGAPFVSRVWTTRPLSSCINVGIVRKLRAITIWVFNAAVKNADHLMSSPCSTWIEDQGLYLPSRTKHLLFECAVLHIPALTLTGLTWEAALTQNPNVHFPILSLKDTPTFASSRMEAYHEQALTDYLQLPPFLLA